MAQKRFIAKNGLDNNAQTIQNVADPVNAQDVATRAYVLANAVGGGGATTAYTRTSFTATAGQTSFTVTYTVGFAEVYLNGVLLNSTDYTASTGTDIVLTLAAVLSDIVEVIAYNVATVVSTVTAINATSPITSSGGNTPTIAMPAATTLANGYLTSTDWNTFNNKVGSGSTLAIANGGTGQTTNGAAYTSLVGYTTVATAGGTTVLDNTSENLYYFTGSLSQTITLPVVTTLILGWSFNITNNSSAGLLTINSSGANLVCTIPFGMTCMVTCVDIAINTTATAWDFGYTDFASITGSGANVLATNPTITTLNLAAGSTTAGSAPLKIGTSSGVVLTTPESGTVEFDGTNFCSTIDTRGVIPSFQQFYLSASGALLSGVAQNYFGASSAAQLAAASTYEIECFCYFSKTTSGTVQWIPSCSNTMTMGHSYLEYIPVTGVTASVITGAMVVGEATGRTLSTLTHTATASLTTAVFHIHKLKIILITNTAVSFRLNVTISAGSVTPQPGSYYIVRKVISSVGTFVA